jgi:hypothetical protein
MSICTENMYNYLPDYFKYTIYVQCPTLIKDLEGPIDQFLNLNKTTYVFWGPC